MDPEDLLEMAVPELAGLEVVRVGQHYLDILVVSFLTFACCRPCTQSHRKANRDALRVLDDANLVYRYTRLGLNERYGSTKVEQVRGGPGLFFLF